MEIRSNLLLFDCATFIQTTNLKTHSVSVHEGNKLFKCEICSTAFVLKRDLKVHSASVHGEKKPFKCDM